MTWTKEREDEIRSRWAGHSSDVDAVFSWLDAEREARQRAEALLATIDKHTAHNDPMQVTASALARSIQRAERERDEARSEAHGEATACRAAIATVESQRRVLGAIAGVMRCEPEDDDDLVEAVRRLAQERDEARAERDAIAARYDALRAAAERLGACEDHAAACCASWCSLCQAEVASGERLRAAIAYPDGAARERAERQAERERRAAVVGFCVAVNRHGGIASESAVIADADVMGEIDEMLASVRGRT